MITGNLWEMVTYAAGKKLAEEFRTLNKCAVWINKTEHYSLPKRAYFQQQDENPAACLG